jgi:hypothetical protein
MAMIDFIIGVFAALVGVLAALFGIGIGLGAMLLALAPLILVVLILLLPVLILVGLLRRIGILGGPFLSLIAIILLVFLLMGGAHHLWASKTDQMKGWLDAKRDQLDACRAAGNDDVNITIDGTDMIITCKSGGSKTGEQPRDVHI